MLALLEVISFHIGLFFRSAIIALILVGPFVIGFLATFYQDAQNAETIALLVLMFSAAIMTGAFSSEKGTYSTSVWEKAQPHTASLLILLGHPAPIAAIYLYLAMAKSGMGSGVVFIPLLIWSAIFYFVGIDLAVKKTKQSKQAR